MLRRVSYHIYVYGMCPFEVPFSGSNKPKGVNFGEITNSHTYFRYRLKIVLKDIKFDLISHHAENL